MDVPSYYQELVDLFLRQGAGGVPDFLLQFLQVSFIVFILKRNADTHTVISPGHKQTRESTVSFK